MQVLEILIYVFLVVFVIASVLVGVVYNRNNKKAKTRVEEQSVQEYVKANLGIFGVSNKGTSMDDRKIYLVPFSKMGY